MAEVEEEKGAQYFSRDFEWERLRDEVERDPLSSYHLSPFPTTPSSPPPGVADADAWRSFHRCHSTWKFFKERRYILKEFPELIVSDASISVLEVGCGNGSTVLPILRSKQDIIIYACDCSQKALDIAGEMVTTADLTFRDRFYPFLHDFSIDKFPDWLLCTVCQSSPRKKFIFTQDANEQCLIGSNKPACLEAECCIGGLEFVTLIFTLSATPFQRMSFVVAECMTALKPGGVLLFSDYAIPFQRMPFVVAECMTVLKPGGLLLFRDYGLFDMTMLRFPSEQRVGFREYMRLDGTFSYFFSLDIVRNLFLGAGFIELELEYCCVISVNRRSGKKMQRVWVHGKFQRPILSTASSSS